ncbi:MAG: ABC transporter permease [Blastocatellia bacterium]
MSTLMQDLRYGARMLMKKPGFTLIAVITLALGIGANSAIFSVVNAALLRPLPFAEPDRLARIWETNLKRDLPFFSVSAPNYVSWKEQSRTFERLAAWKFRGVNLTGRGEPERLEGAAVSGSLFSLLGVKPGLGRDFLPEEDQPHGRRAVIIGYGLWERRFGRDPNLIGQGLILDGVSHIVVGIAPSGFDFPGGAEMWAPLAADLARENRGNKELAVIGRLKPGVTLQQARTELTTIAQRLEQQFPDTNSDWGVRLETLFDSIITNETRTALLILLGAVGFLLLIACANVANLTLARATGRASEMAIRAALGASRWRISRQLLTESLLLALAGGGAGVLLALWGVDLLRAASPQNTPRLDEIGVDGWVLGFTLTVSLLTGVLFGLAPALQAAKVDLQESLKEGGRTSATGGVRNLLRRGLVVVELALSLVLLVGAALMIRSLWNLQRTPLGFDPESVLTAQVRLPEGKYGPEQGVSFYQQVRERVAGLPGVRAASWSSGIPFTSGNTSNGIIAENSTLAPGELLQSEWRVVSPDYFRTLGIPLLQGRDFTERDNLNAPISVIISQALAGRLWPNQNPLGRRLRFGPRLWVTVAGVVGNVRNVSLSIEPRPMLYLCAYSLPLPVMTLAARAEADPRGVIAAIRAKVKEVDPDMPLANLQTTEEILDRASAQPRFNTWLLGAFAAIALGLGAVGIYGVIAYSVAQRAHEIGVRMALGARGADVLKLILKQGMTLTLIGVAIGLVVSFALTRRMKTLLYGVSATDPATFTVIVLLLTFVALLACWIPARRATKVDPMIALRSE